MENPQDIALLIVLGSLVFCFFIVAFVLFAINYQKRILGNDNKLKAVKALQQIELFNASAEIEEREKARIARNLHDEINPLLNVLKQNLQRHRLYIMKNKFQIESFNQDFELIDKAMEGIRNSSYELVPSFLIDYGLIVSLKDYIRSLNDAEILPASFINTTHYNETAPFIKQEQLNIYRVCLELINNILKHAACSQLSLHLSVLLNNFIIEFKHDGQGISNAEVEKFAQIEGGLGLKSLKARVLILGANISYEKGKENSTIVLKIPIKND
jgi:signal transduction histidine kinase